jgi:hypothetical protein
MNPNERLRVVVKDGLEGDGQVQILAIRLRRPQGMRIHIETGLRSTEGGKAPVNEVPFATP